MAIISVEWWYESFASRNFGSETSAKVVVGSGKWSERFFITFTKIPSYSSAFNNIKQSTCGMETVVCTSFLKRKYSPWFPTDTTNRWNLHEPPKPRPPDSHFSQVVFAVKI